MNRYGIATWTFAGDSLLDKVRDFADMGYNAASVQGDFLEKLPVDQADVFASFVADRDLLLTVHTAFRFEGGTVDRTAALRQTEQILSWHAGTSRIACLTYDIPWTEVQPEVWRQEVESVAGPFEDILALTAGSGIRVGLEDCPLYDDHLPRLQSWRQRFPHYGALMDLGHMNIRIKRPDRLPVPDPPLDSGAYLKRIPVEIIEIHVHNNDGTKDQHCPPYTGTGDMPSAASALKDIGFDGISTIEIVPDWCKLSPEEALDAARKSLEYWRTYLGN